MYEHSPSCRMVPQVFLVPRRYHQQLLRYLGHELGFARPDHVTHPPGRFTVCWVTRLQRLHELQLRVVGVLHRYATHLVIRVQEIHSAPVRERWHREASHIAQRRLIVERRSKQPARLGAESRSVLGAPAFRDVAANSHQARGISLSIAKQAPPCLEPPNLSVRAEDAVKQVMRVAGEALLNGSHHPLPVLGIHVALVLLERPAEGARLQPMDSFERLGPAHTVLRDRPFPGAHSARFERQTKPFLVRREHMPSLVQIDHALVELLVRRFQLFGERLLFLHLVFQLGGLILKLRREAQSFGSRFVGPIAIGVDHAGGVAEKAGKREEDHRRHEVRQRSDRERSDRRDEEIVHSQHTERCRHHRGTEATIPRRRGRPPGSASGSACRPGTR